MRAAVALLVVLLPMLLAQEAGAQVGASPAEAAVVASQIELRAETLTHAGDLTVDAMQRLAWDLEARMDALSDLAAPYPSLAALIPDMRISAASLLNAAMLGTASDVASAASDLQQQARTFRVLAGNLAGAP